MGPHPRLRMMPSSELAGISVRHAAENPVPQIICITDLRPEETLSWQPALPWQPAC